MLSIFLKNIIVFSYIVKNKRIKMISVETIYSVDKVKMLKGEL